MSDNGKRGKVLVIGGGISGITAAVEASEAGCEVAVRSSWSKGTRTWVAG